MTDKIILERFSCTRQVNSEFYLNDGLQDGKTGAAIFFFNCARKTEEDVYENLANCLLDNLFDNLSDKKSLEFAKGLCGIGWGIEYLLQHGFVEGDANEVLSDIDIYVINEICFQHMTGLNLDWGVIGLGRYILMRLRSTWQYEDTHTSLALKENLIYLIDWLGELMQKSSEPKDDLLDLLQELYENGFYKTKVRKMIQQCTQ